MQSVKRFFTTLFRRAKQRLSDNEEGEQEETIFAKPVELQTKSATKKVSQNAAVLSGSREAKSQMTQAQSLKSLKNAAEFKSKADSSPNWARPVEINSCKSTVTSFVASALRRKASGSDESIAEGSKSSLSRIRRLSERAVRRVKTFVSRPIKETTMLRFVSKVEAKKQAEESGRISAREMKLGDDPFPKPRSRTSKSREITVEHYARDGPDLNQLKSVPQVPMSYRHGDLPSGCQLVLGNKNNKGKLIIDDKPFWTEQRKPTDEDLEESETDDELQMSAEVALDVYEGKVMLVNMPTVPVVLDPMNELCELQRRDKLFYSKDVLFGNSVRSMINLCDNSMNVAPIKRRTKSELVKFEEPSTRYSYRRGCLFDIVKEPFIPRSKKYISRKSSRKRKKRSSETERNKGENKDLRKKASPTDQGKDQKSGIETRALETLKYADEQRQYGEMHNENSKQQLSLGLPKEDLTTRES